MAAPSGTDSIRAILLDIEGTTTPIDFVFKVLFPYARQRFRHFLQENHAENDVRKDIEALRAQHQRDAGEGLNPPEWIGCQSGFELDSATSYCLWLMDRDSKCSPLKSLQGKIWSEGYSRGELRGEIYTDVPVAFERWSRQGRTICIYSSGSVLAQKLIFSHSTAGDMSRYLHSYFDTTVGPKSSPESYSAIARALTLGPAKILFISDVQRELDAARNAGMHTSLCDREKQTASTACGHQIICSFDEIFFEN